MHSHETGIDADPLPDGWSEQGVGARGGLCLRTPAEPSLLLPGFPASSSKKKSPLM